MSPEWTTKWPRAPGLYWFYGYAMNKQVDTFPRLHLVTLEYVSKMFGAVYRTGRASLKQETGAYGYWKAIDVPVLPEIDEEFERLADQSSTKLRNIKDLEFIG